MKASQRGMSGVLDFGERLALRRARSHTPIQGPARHLAADAENVAAAIAEQVLASEPRLVDRDDPTLAALAERAVHSTVGAMLSALAYGVPMDAARPTDAAVRLFDRLADNDDGLAVALRTQRRLAAELWQVWASFTDDHVQDRTTHRSLLAASTRQLDAYTDSVCDYLTNAWPEARRRRRRGVDVPVEELIGRALHGAPESAADALAKLGYPADGLHLAVAVPGSDNRREGLARRLKLACGTRTLTDAATVWVALTRSTTEEHVARVRPLLDLDAPLGLGDPGHGLEGFRRTRQQAADALRVASLRGGTGITRYRDVALLAVLCADETRARELARIELGPLAGDDEVAVRLRETLGAYVATGENQVATARRLFVHEKTVKYRLRQAEDLLGCKVAERRAQIETALMVHRAFNE